MENSKETRAKHCCRLVSCDGKPFDCSDDVVAQLGTVRCLMENMMGNEVDVIPLFEADSEALERVLAWCEKHTDVNKAAMGGDVLRMWEEEFLAVPTDLLYKLIMAANYLDASQLLDQLARRVADLIKGKSPEETRKTFGIRCDF